MEIMNLIVSLAATLSGVFLTHHYNLKRTQFEYFLKVKYDVLLDLYNSIFDCKEILYHYVNLLSNYKNLDPDQRRNIFFSEVQPVILKFDLSKQRATAFLREHKRLSESLEEFSHVATCIALNLRIQLVDNGKPELQFQKIKEECFDPNRLLEKFSKVVREFDSVLEALKEQAKFFGCLKIKFARKKC